MKKQDILTALEGKFHKVLTPVIQRGEADINWYIVGVYDLTNETMLRSNIPFYVENEGTDNEVAYWGAGEPKPTPGAPTFTTKVNGYITSKIADNIIKEGNIERINDANKTAVVRVLLEESGALRERRLLVNEGTNGNLQHVKIEVSA